MLTKKDWIMVTVIGGVLGGLWINGNLHPLGMF